MNRFRLIAVPAALLATSAIAIGCGGVPKDSVATVDGKSIKKSSFDRGMQLVAKGETQGRVALPDPPTFAKCIAAQRKQIGKPKKGMPKVSQP